MKAKSPSKKGGCSSKKVRKGDTVMVLRGESRGRSGVVLSCEENRVLIQGVNMRKKHMKPTQQQPKGAIVELEKPIHISNVMVCVNDKPVKLRTRVGENGNRELYYRDGDSAVTYRSLKNQK